VNVCNPKTKATDRRHFLHKASVFQQPADVQQRVGENPHIKIALAGVKQRFFRQKTMTRNFGLFIKLLLSLLLFATVVSYGWIHWRLIWLSEPLTIRESVLVIDVRGYLDPHAARPYTLESIPQYTNLYGIGYLWGGAPFSAFLPFPEYSNLRLANAFYLGLLLVVLWMGSNAGTPLQRLFGLVLVYALFVSSPSVAASPDVLGCLLYTLAWVIVVRRNFSFGALFLSILLAFLAFLTKPYFVLAAGSIGSYLFFFRSKRLGLIYSLGVIALFAPGLWFIYSRYPYYFFETFKIHTLITTISFENGLRQWREFIILALVPCFVFAWTVAAQLRKSYRTVRFQGAFNDPFFSKSLSINPYDWGALMALAVLAGLLSWHQGAYLIYFFHLLLPLLVLGIMNRPAVNPIWPCLNIAALLYLCPSLPPVKTSADWIALGKLVAKHPNAYIDPYFESLLPPGRPVLIDNGLSEYLISMGYASGSPDLRAHCKGCFHDFKDKICERRFDSLVLAPGFFLSHALSNLIMENYEVSGTFTIQPYYGAFRNRLSFGHAGGPALFLTPRKTNLRLPNALPPIPK
jgi:hypothetical protein